MKVIRADKDHVIISFKLNIEKYIKLCRIACSNGITVNTLLYKIVDDFIEKH